MGKKITITAELEDRFSAEFNRLVGSLDRLVVALGSSDKATTKSTSSNVGLEKSSKNLSVQLTREEQVIKALDEQRKKDLATLNKSKAGYDNFALSFIKQVAGITTVAVAVTVAIRKIAQAVESSINSLRSFETGLTGVSKAADLSVRDTAKFGNLIDSMSKRLPIPRQQLLEIAEAAGRAGVKTVEELEKITETVAKLSTATDLVGGDAVDTLLRLFTSTGDSIDRIDKVGSALVSLGNNSAAAEKRIAEFGTVIAPIFARFKSGAEIPLAFAASLDQIGLEAEASRTGLRKLFDTIETAVRIGGDELQRFADIAGVSAAEFTKQFEGNPIVAIQTFLGGLKEVEESGALLSGVISDLGFEELRTRNVIEGLARTHLTLARNLNLVTTEIENSTALESEFRKFASTLDSQFTLLENGVLNLGKEFALSFKPAIDEVLKSLIELSQSPEIVSGLKSIGETIGFAAEAAFVFKDGLEIANNILKSIGVNGKNFKVSNLFGTAGSVVEFERASGALFRNLRKEFQENTVLAEKFSQSFVDSGEKASKEIGRILGQDIGGKFSDIFSLQQSDLQFIASKFGEIGPLLGDVLKGKIASAIQVATGSAEVSEAARVGSATIAGGLAAGIAIGNQRATSEATKEARDEVVRTSAEIGAAVSEITESLELSAARAGVQIADLESEIFDIQARAAKEINASFDERVAIANTEFNVRKQIAEIELAAARENLNSQIKIAGEEGVRLDESIGVLEAQKRLTEATSELNKLEDSRFKTIKKIAEAHVAESAAIDIAKMEAAVKALENQKAILEENKQILIESGLSSRVDLLNQELELERSILQSNIGLLRTKLNLEDSETNRIKLLSEIEKLEGDLANQSNRAKGASIELVRSLTSTAKAAQDEYKSTLQEIANLVKIGSKTEAQGSADAVAAAEKRNVALAGVREEFQRLSKESPQLAGEVAAAIQSLDALTLEAKEKLGRRIEETISNISSLRSSADSAFSGFFSELIKSGGDLESAIQGLLARLTDAFIEFSAQEATNRLFGGTLDALLGGAQESKGGALGGLLGTGGAALAGGGEGGVPVVDIAAGSQQGISGGVGAAVTTGVGGLFSGITGLFSNLFGSITQALTIAPLIAINTAILGAVGIITGFVGAIALLLLPLTVVTGLVAALLIPLSIVTALALPVLVLVAAGIPIIIGLLAGILAVSAFDAVTPFAAGGPIPGPDTHRDSVPIMAMPKEFMLNRRASMYYGHGFLNLLNRMAIPREALVPSGAGYRSKLSAMPIQHFAAGGPVSAPSARRADDRERPTVAIIKSNEEAVEEFLRGGPNAMLEFMSTFGGRAFNG